MERGVPAKGTEGTVKVMPDDGTERRTTNTGTEPRWSSKGGRFVSSSSAFVRPPGAGIGETLIQASSTGRQAGRGPRRRR